MMKRLKGLVGTTFAMLTLVIATGCGAETETPDETRETIEVEHQLGTTTVNVNPQNVVVLDFGPLDALHYLGVDVLGVPQSSNIPAHLSVYTGEEFVNAGGLAEPDFEAIFEMQPELIIIGGRLADHYDDLSDIAPTIHMTMGEEYMPSFEANMRLLGEIFEKQEEVEVGLASITERVEALYAIVTEEEREALILLVNDGVLSAFGAQSRFGIINNTFGFIPAADIEGTSRGEEINFEFVLEKNPEYIFVIDRGAILGHEGARDMLDNDLVNATRAGEIGNIFFLNNEVWHTAPGGFGSTSIMIDEILAAVE